MNVTMKPPLKQQNPPKHPNYMVVFKSILIITVNFAVFQRPQENNLKHPQSLLAFPTKTYESRGLLSIQDHFLKIPTANGCPVPGTPVVKTQLRLDDVRYENNPRKKWYVSFWPTDVVKTQLKPSTEAKAKSLISIPKSPQFESGSMWGVHLPMILSFFYFFCCSASHAMGQHSAWKCIHVAGGVASCKSLQRKTKHSFR